MLIFGCGKLQVVLKTAPKVKNIEKIPFLTRFLQKTSLPFCGLVIDMRNKKFHIEYMHFDLYLKSKDRNFKAPFRFYKKIIAINQLQYKYTVMHCTFIVLGIFFSILDIKSNFYGIPKTSYVIPCMVRLFHPARVFDRLEYSIYECNKNIS